LTATPFALYVEESSRATRAELAADRCHRGRFDSRDVHDAHTSCTDRLLIKDAAAAMHGF
jgi:hypothetical protein